MKIGIIKLFCPICKRIILYNDPNPPHNVYHHKEFGILCSELCYRDVELKYAKMILGKDDC